MPTHISEPTLEETIAYAAELHAGQVDFGGRPYIDHLMAVLNLLPEDATDIQKKTAVLHDTLEDVILDKGLKTERRLTSDDLRRRGFREEIIENVEILTKPDEPRNKYHGLTPEQRNAKSESDYLANIQKIIDSGRVDAMIVKMADNTHNGDPSRDRWLTDPKDLAKSARLRQRYIKSIAMLIPAIAHHKAQEEEFDGAPGPKGP